VVYLREDNNIGVLYGIGNLLEFMFTVFEKYFIKIIFLHSQNQKLKICRTFQHIKERFYEI